MALSLFFAFILAPNPTGFTEKIEARIGAQIITSTDLHLEVEALQKAALEKKSGQTLRKAAMDKLIEQALVREYLSNFQMDVSDQDVERKIDSIRSAQGIQSIGEFRRMLESQGLSFSDFRKQVKEQMRLAQFTQILQRDTLQTVDEKELQSFYKDHASQFASNWEYELQECLIPYGESRKKVTKIAKGFQNKPATFGKCVSDFSRGPSAANKGMLGKIEGSVLRDEVSSSLKSKRPNQIALIELPGAIQLLKIISKRDLGPRSFDKVKDDIKNSILTERMNKARQRLIADLRAKTYIKIAS